MKAAEVNASAPAALLMSVVLLGVYFLLPNGNLEQTTPVSSYKLFDKAAVVCNAGPCSTVGKDILKKGGSVVDSGIATAICLGVISLQSTGIGGGSFMNYYNAATGKSYFIDSREVAPLAGYPEMLNETNILKKFGKSYIAVPGEVAGYWEAHRRFGTLKWSDLFHPSIKIASGGFHMTGQADRMLQRVATVVKNNKKLRSLLSNPDGSLKRTGDIIVRPRYAETLRVIAEEGPYAFYNGSLTKSILKDIHEGFGQPSLITAEDLANYKVLTKKILKIKLGNYTMLIPGAPSGAPVLTFILNVLKGYNFTSQTLNTEKDEVLTYHRIVEAIKFGFSRRQHLGDADFNPDIQKLVSKMLSHKYGEQTRGRIDDNQTHSEGYYSDSKGDNLQQIPEDHGTADLGVLGPDGSAFAMTTTINLPFGSNVLGDRTGIIFNNEMADFTVMDRKDKDQKSNNFVEPGKRPLSSMVPTIILKNGNKKPEVKMVIGGEGGTRITTATVLAIINNLWFGKNLDESITAKRLHHTLIPNTLFVEKGTDQTLIDGLTKLGHDIKIQDGISAVQAIVKQRDGKIAAKCDERKGGYPAGF